MFLRQHLASARAHNPMADWPLDMLDLPDSIEPMTMAPADSSRSRSSDSTTRCLYEIAMYRSFGQNWHLSDLVRH
jgi:hypothetical protein